MSEPEPMPVLAYEAPPPPEAEAPPLWAQVGGWLAFAAAVAVPVGYFLLLLFN